MKEGINGGEYDLYGQQQMSANDWEDLTKLSQDNKAESNDVDIDKKLKNADTHEQATSDDEIRKQWEENARAIAENAVRNEGENIDDFRNRINGMIPTLEEFRAGLKTSEQAPVTPVVAEAEATPPSQGKEPAKWSTLSDKAKRELHDKYPRQAGESTDDWAKRIEASEGNIFSHGQNKFAEQLATAQEQNAEKAEPLKDTLESMQNSIDRLNKLVEEYSQLKQRIANAANNLRQSGAVVTPIGDAKAVEPAPATANIEAQPAADNKEDKENNESTRKEDLRLIRSRKATGFYAELGIKAADLENYSDAELNNLKNKIEAKIADKQDSDNDIENLSDEERIAKNRRNLRSRKYAKYLKDAKIDPRKIDSMSDEELALALGSIEIAYEKDVKAKAEEERRKAEAEAEAKNKSEQAKTKTVEIGGFESKEQATEALKRIARRAAAMAEISFDDPSLIAKAVEDAAKDEAAKVTPIEDGGFSQKRADELNQKLEYMKRQVWDANSRLQNTKGFFKRRKAMKEIDALSAQAKQAENELAAELSKRQAPTPTNHQFDSRYRSSYYDNNQAA